MTTNPTKPNPVTCFVLAALLGASFLDYSPPYIPPSPEALEAERQFAEAIRRTEEAHEAQRKADEQRRADWDQKHWEKEQARRQAEVEDQARQRQAMDHALRQLWKEY